MAANSIVFSHGVFCPPLPGKPGPYAADGASRLRIPQSVQKGETCIYYALQILRNERKIGKYSSRKLPESRFIERLDEKAISKYRKSKTKADYKFGPLFSFEKAIKTELDSGSFSREQAACFLRDKDKIDNIVPKHRQKVCDALTSFCAQNVHHDFSTYLYDQQNQALEKANQQFFEHFDLFPRDCYAEEELGKKPWKDLSQSELSGAVYQTVFYLMRSAYGCVQSSWHPEQGIEHLIEQLKAHGPHFMGGQIGRSYYEDAPSVLPQSIEGRPILYWKVNAKRIESYRLHAVVVVGAQINKQGQQLVYFLDPLDGSDPQDITTQKVYVMSYKRLKEAIVSLDGYRSKNPVDGSPIFLEQKLDENSYALHME